MSHTNDSILVTGANGVLGRAVVHHLHQQGLSFFGAGRHSTPPGFPGEWRQSNLLQASSVETALQHVTTIIHCASSPQTPNEDREALKNLIAACRKTNAHLVYVSICGIEDSALNHNYHYYRVKLADEAELQSSGIAHTIVRIAQFHPFVELILTQLIRGPIILRPTLNLQPIDVNFAAEHLVHHALQRTAGRTKDLHGPETLNQHQLIDTWLSTRNLHKLAIPIPRLGRLNGVGYIQHVEGNTGGPTWQQWLTSGAANPYLSS